MILPIIYTNMLNAIKSADENMLQMASAFRIPFMPAKNAPLSAEGGAGSVATLYREIALLRLMIPSVDITAQQPGCDLSKGLTDPESNLNAIKAGANVLFCELLDPEVGKNFGVIDNRNISGTEHIFAASELAGMEVSF